MASDPADAFTYSEAEDITLPLAHEAEAGRGTEGSATRRWAAGPRPADRTSCVRAARPLRYSGGRATLWGTLR